MSTRHDQQTLRLAPEDVVLQARYEMNGWHLQVAVRRQGERWGDRSWTHYEGLTTSELIQTVDDHLSAQL